jgi:hypothetical protein
MTEVLEPAAVPRTPAFQGLTLPTQAPPLGSMPPSTEFVLGSRLALAQDPRTANCHGASGVFSWFFETFGDPRILPDIDGSNPHLRNLDQAQRGKFSNLRTFTEKPIYQVFVLLRPSLPLVVVPVLLI